MIVYQEMQNGKRVSLGVAKGIEGAKVAMADLAAKWKATKPGRRAVIDGITATFLFSDGKQASIIYAEPEPVPAQEPDAQPRRKKGAKA